MATANAEQALELARAEARMLADQLRQARADLHRLGISDQTVNTHIKNMYRKLQVRTRAQAVNLASMRGLL